MNNNSGALSFEAIINNSQWNTRLTEMENQVRGFTKSVVKETDNIDNSFKRLGQLAAGGFAFAGLSQLPGQIVKVRGDFQQLELAFNTMLGSKAKADSLMKDIVKFAGSTPFDLQGVANASKQLLAYGFSSDEVITKLRRLGDVSAGLNIPLGELTELYGKTRTNGRLFAEDLNQYVGRGIPLIKLLADQFKVAESEVRGLVETGKVGFLEVDKAINTLTNKGGMFAGLTEESSKAINGLKSNFGDAVDQMFNDLGKSQEGAITELLKGGISVVENYQQVLDILKVLIATYGAYKAVVITTAAIQSASGAAGAISAWFSLAATIRSAKDAQIAFNLATAANPIGAAIAVVAGLAAVYAVYGNELSEAQKANELMNDARKKGEDGAASEISKIQALQTSINNENLSREVRLTKLKELIALSPKHLGSLNLENIATDQGTTAIDNYVAAMKRKIEAQEIDAGLAESIKRQNKAKRGENELSYLDQVLLSAKTSSNPYSATSGQDFQKGKVNAQKALNDEIVKGEQNIQDQYKERLKLLDELDDKSAKSGAANAEVVVKNVSYYDIEIKKLKELQSKKAENKATYDEYQKQIETLEKSRDRITGGKVKKVAEKDLPQPFGSIAYYEQVARKADEILNKLPGTNAAAIAKQNQIKLDAEKKADEIRKLSSVKTFDDELSDKKNKYEQYQRWIDHYSQAAADANFSNLISQGSSYAAYLDGEIKKLEAQKAIPGIGLIAPEEEKLVKLKIEYADATDAKSPLQRLQDDLSKAKDNTRSLSEYLDILYKKQSEIGTGGGTTGDGQRKFISEEIVGVESQLNGILQDFLVETQTYAKKRIDIETNYNRLRKTANKQLSGEELSDAIKQIDKQKKLELEAIGDEEQEKSESYKRIHQEVLEYGRKQIKQKLADIQETLKSEQVSIKRRKELELEFAKTKKELEKNTLAGVQEAASLINQVLGDVNLNVSKTFSIGMKDLSGAMSNVSKLMDSEASTTDQIGSIVGLVSFVAVTVRDAFMKADDLLTGMEGQDSFYKNMANEIEGVNILLERQANLLNGLKGTAKIAGQFNLIDQYAKQQDEALQQLKDMSVDVITKQTEVFVDPILGTEIKNKGFAGVWTSLMTGGQAKTKIKYEFESVDTKGFDDIEDFIKLLSDIKKNGGKLNGKEVVAADIESLELLIKTYQDAEASQQQLMEAFKQYLTATTEDSIVDSIVDGFRNGKSAAADFADDFGKMMENALVNSLKAKLMNEDMDAFYKKFSDYSLSDGVLNSAEIADLKTIYNSIIAKGKQEYDNLQQITGIDLSAGSAKNQSALSGAIQGVSQQTANVLEGNITALRITTADSNVQLRNILFNISNISQNSNYLPLLLDISNTLKNMKVADTFNRQFGGQ